MELHKKIPVVILHVENPNRFWFRTTSDACRLNSALESYRTGQNVSNSYVPKLNDVISVNLGEKREFARVKDVLGEIFIDISILGSGQNYRIPWRAALQLTDQLIDMAVNTLLLGSISGVFPVKKELNNRLMSTELKKTTAWSQESTYIMAQICMEPARSVYFRSTKFNNNCYYGELTYEKCISDVLLDMEYAIRLDETECNGNEHGFLSNGSSVEQYIPEDESDIHPVINLRPINSRKNDEISDWQSKCILNGNYTKTKNAVNGSGKLVGNSVDSETKSSNGSADIEVPIVVRNEIIGLSHPLSPITERTENSDNSFSTSEKSSGSKAQVSPVENSNDFEDVSLKCSEVSNRSPGACNDENSGKKIVEPKELEPTDANTTADWEENSNGTFVLDGVSSVTLDDVPSETAEANVEDEAFADTEEKELEIAASYQESSKASSMVNNHIKEENRSVSVQSYVPSYLYDSADSEEEPEKYQYTEEGFEKRDREVMLSIQQTKTDKLLSDAKLYDNEPITNINIGSEPTEPLVTCELADKALARSNKVYPIQRTVWPHILRGSSAILVGDTEYYPHLLYLPAVCGLIERMENDQKNVQKVVILASDQQQAESIRNISTCYLGEIPPDPVYSNAANYSNVSNDTLFRNCKIFVTLPNRICQNLNQEPLKSVKCIVVNNFETIPPKHRQRIIDFMNGLKTQFIITSKYYVPELKQIMDKRPNVFVSTESHFDLFHLTSEENGSRSTDVVVVDQRTSPAEFQLRSKLKSLAKLESNWRVVVVCTNLESAEALSNTLKLKYRMNNTLNGKPTKGSILVCSDDQLMAIGVKTAYHIIHYDLPDDLDTFSRRYSVFERSHCEFQVMGSRDTRTSSSSASSTIIITIDGTATSLHNKKTLLMLSMLSREYSFDLLPKMKDRFLEIAQKLNADAPLCIDIASNFTKVGHLIKCKNRHLFQSLSAPQNARFPPDARCLVEIQHVISPVYFTVRILKLKDANGIWCHWNFADSFHEFSADLNEFYSKSFIPLQNTSDVDMNRLYVVRIGNQFLRCKILDTNIGGSSGKFRVQRVDHGMPHRADISDIGQLEREYHKTFPIQSINLCLLELTPWNEQNWSVDDTDYVKKLVGNGSFEITIFNEVYSELIFTKNLISRNPNTDVICVDYAKHIISKGIASKSLPGLKEFFGHLIDDHCLCVIPTD